MSYSRLGETLEASYAGNHANPLLGAPSAVAPESMPEELKKPLSEEEAAGIFLAGGSANPELNARIASKLGCELGAVTLRTHPNGETYTRYETSVRNKDVYIIQPHIRYSGRSVNDAIWEQSMLASGARSSSARSITAVVPHVGYGRQERMSREREAIAAGMVLQQLKFFGVGGIVTIDMHSSAVQGVFSGPFDHLSAQSLLRCGMRETIEEAGYSLDDCAVVAPDAGASKLASEHRKKLGTGIIHLAKSRDANDSQIISREQRVPEAEGRVCLLFDDMIDTAGTLVTAADALRNSGALAVFAAATHGIFSDPAISRLQNSVVDKIIVTDTHTTSIAQYELGNRLRVLSVAPMIANTLKMIIRGGSVSEVIKYQNQLS